MNQSDVLDGSRWLNEVKAAQSRIQGLTVLTPLVPALALSRQVGHEVWLKYEQLQPTGAFKVRGAANFLRQQAKAKGAVTYSTGNHGLAVAYVAKSLNMTATVCLSRHVPSVKVQALRELGADVKVVGESQDEAGLTAMELSKEPGQVLVKPFDDPAIIAGQGTIAAEFLEQLPQTGTVLVPLSGGGLLAGIAAVCKTLRPALKVVGVSMQNAPVMYHSVAAGKPVEMPEQPTLADSLQGGIGRDNQWTLAMIAEWVDQTVLVSEEEIGKAMAYLALNQGQLVEGAAAVGVAALLNGRVAISSGPVVVVVTGRTVDPRVLMRLMEKYLATSA